VRPERILKEASLTLVQRGIERDAPQGERSMAQTVDIFKAITGIELTERQGWTFMVALKIARSTRGKPNPDHFIDLAGYAALLGESALEGRFDEASEVSP
jgi:Domain of unknown function (DUF6378)